MADQEISPAFPFAINSLAVEHEIDMAYIDTDPTHQLPGPPVVFMHGNPAYSYLWRNIIPHIMSKARCVAPDLIGMGSSSKVPNDAYGWDNHNRYLEAFFSSIFDSDEMVVLVLHDFGSLFGLNWARNHPERVAGLVLMEFLPPMLDWEAPGKMSDELQEALGGSSADFRKAIVDENVMIELFLQDQVVRKLSQTEMDYYRKPFVNPASRESLHTMSKLFPVAGNPPDVYEAVEKYNTWLLDNDVPKLFFWADPGKVMPPKLAKYYSENLKNTKSVAVGKAKHYLQEDHPHLIGNEIKIWLETSGILG